MFLDVYAAIFKLKPFFKHKLLLQPTPMQFALVIRGRKEPFANLAESECGASN
jgi:hypothetical protein